MIDEGSTTSELDALLAREPENIAALLRRGECYEQDGNVRAATSFYKNALKLAAARGFPQDLAPALREAQASLQRRGQEYQQWLDSALARQADSNLRIRHALEMLAGRREIYPQSPTVFYFPYLPQRQFYEREEFNWAPQLEAATDDIRSELGRLLEQNAEFRPYMEAAPDRPRSDFHGLLGNPRWSAFYLWKDGELVEENAARCPKTVEAMSRVPLSQIAGRTPSVLFSLLQPGAQIPPHHGMLNSRLICHLPLIVPSGCTLRVGNERREWEESKLLIFDDSIEHEAANPSDRLRVVLLFDIWRPELNEEERAAVSAIFEAIDSFVGAPDD